MGYKENISVAPLKSPWLPKGTVDGKTVGIKTVFLVIEECSHPQKRGFYTLLSEVLAGYEMYSLEIILCVCGHTPITEFSVLSHVLADIFSFDLHNNPMR